MQSTSGPVTIGIIMETTTVMYRPNNRYNVLWEKKNLLSFKVNWKAQIFISTPFRIALWRILLPTNHEKTFKRQPETMLQ